MRLKHVDSPSKGVMRSARTMGDAMLTAALAFGAERHDR